MITLYGLLTPDSPAELAGFSALLAPMLAAAPPTGVQVQMMPYSTAAAIFAGADPTKLEWMLHPHNDRQQFKSTSAVAYEPFPPKPSRCSKHRSRKRRRRPTGTPTSRA